MTDDRKKAIRATATAMAELSMCPAPSLGIDLDGCVDESPIFFQLLSRYWPGKVFVLTYRNDRPKTVNDLARYSIRYDKLILVDSFDSKAKAIEQEGIAIYIDDQPEMLKHVSPLVSVCLFRNDGNFDFQDRRWMLSQETGKLV